MTTSFARDRFVTGPGLGVGVGARAADRAARPPPDSRARRQLAGAAALGEPAGGGAQLRAGVASNWRRAQVATPAGPSSHEPAARVLARPMQNATKLARRIASDSAGRRHLVSARQGQVGAARRGI